VLLARAGAHEGNAGMLMGLAGLVVMLYNGLYTPLKPVSPFCLLPGGAAGAMPPLFGWVAAGGDPLDVRVLVLAGALFCWQVPHFWLFAQRHRADYEAAGCPVPAALGRTAPRLPLLAWLGGYVALMLLTALLVPSLRAGPAVVPVAVWLSACLAAGLAGLACLRSNREGRGFGLVNGSMLVFLAGLAAGTLLGPAA
jgi:protoheme IX farnesyltransferase